MSAMPGTEFALDVDLVLLALGFVHPQRDGLLNELGVDVDARGNVHGTERLSVIDASIMPDVPSGFTHVPTIMIAERLSDHVASHL